MSQYPYKIETFTYTKNLLYNKQYLNRACCLHFILMGRLRICHKIYSKNLVYYILYYIYVYMSLEDFFFFLSLFLLFTSPSNTLSFLLFVSEQGWSAHLKGSEKLSWILWCLHVVCVDDWQSKEFGDFLFKARTLFLSFCASKKQQQKKKQMCVFHSLVYKAVMRSLICNLGFFHFGWKSNTIYQVNNMCPVTNLYK